MLGSRRRGAGQARASGHQRRTGGCNGTTWHGFAGTAASHEISNAMAKQVQHRMALDDRQGARGHERHIGAAAAWSEGGGVGLFFWVKPQASIPAADHIYVSRDLAELGLVRVVSARVVTDSCDGVCRCHVIDEEGLRGPRETPGACVCGGGGTWVSDP